MVLPACPLLNPSGWDAHLPMPSRSNHLDATSRAFPAPTRASDTSWDDHWNSCGSVFNFQIFQWGQTSGGNWTPRRDDRQLQPLALVTNSEPAWWSDGNSIDQFFSGEHLGTENSAKAKAAKMLIETQKSKIQMDFRCLLGRAFFGARSYAELWRWGWPLRNCLGISAGSAILRLQYSFCQWNLPMFSSQRSKRLQVKYRICLPVKPRISQYLFDALKTVKKPQMSRWWLVTTVQCSCWNPLSNSPGCKTLAAPVVRFLVMSCGSYFALIDRLQSSIYTCVVYICIWDQIIRYICTYTHPEYSWMVYSLYMIFCIVCMCVYTTHQASIIWALAKHWTSRHWKVQPISLPKFIDVHKKS